MSNDEITEELGNSMLDYLEKFEGFSEKLNRDDMDSLYFMLGQFSLANLMRATPHVEIVPLMNHLQESMDNTCGKTECLVCRMAHFFVCGGYTVVNEAMKRMLEASNDCNLVSNSVNYH